jgi:CDP-L-myo-inositol myo-inositolphosphotransferase
VSSHVARLNRMSAPDITQTVILAAGNGSRLGSHATGVPKPLVKVAGLPLIAHALGHAERSGCVEAVIVVGYESDRVCEAVEALQSPLRIRFVHNPASDLPNGVSLQAAAPFAASRFFLQMVDHVFAGAALPRLVRNPFEPGEEGRVLIDHAPRDLDLEDATKVRLTQRRVTAIGKGLEPWDAIDAGCFVLTTTIFDALREVRDKADRTVSSGMRQLAVRGALGAAGIGGLPWIDLDTPADQQVAERLLRR